MSLDGSNNPEGEEAMTTAVSFSSAEDSNNSKQSKRPRLTVNQEENDKNENNNDNSHNGNEDNEASTDPTLERKRLRDRQRRAEYAKSFEDLLSLLIDLDPDVRSMLERENNLVGMGHIGRDDQQLVSRLQMVTRVSKLAQNLHKENEQRKLLIHELTNMLGVSEAMAGTRMRMRLKANSLSAATNTTTASTAAADHLQHQLAATSALNSSLLGGGAHFALLQQQQLTAQLHQQHATMIAAGAAAGSSLLGGAGPYSALWPGVALPSSYLGGGSATISSASGSGLLGGMGAARRTSVPTAHRPEELALLQKYELGKDLGSPGRKELALLGKYNPKLVEKGNNSKNRSSTDKNESSDEDSEVTDSTVTEMCVADELKFERRHFAKKERSASTSSSTASQNAKDTLMFELQYAKRDAAAAAGGVAKKKKRERRTSLSGRTLPVRRRRKEPTQKCHGNTDSDSTPMAVPVDDDDKFNLQEVDL